MSVNLAVDRLPGPGGYKISKVPVMADPQGIGYMSVSGLVRIIFLSHTCIAMIDYYIIYILRKRRTNNTMLAERNACIPPTFRCLRLCSPARAQVRTKEEPRVTFIYIERKST